MDKNNANLFAVLLMTVGIVALVGGVPLIFFIALIISLFIFFLRYWTEHIFDNLIVKRRFSQPKVHPGQSLFLELELTNKKLLPVIWLKLSSRVSHEIVFADPKYTNEIIGRRKKYQDLYSINPYQTVKRKYALHPEKRGVMSLYMHQMSYTDPLGLVNEEVDQEAVNLIVYPRILPLASPLPDFSMLFGSRRKEGWIFQDKLNRTGVRPYSPADSFRQINWKASARSMELKSDIYKPSLDREVHLFHGLWRKRKEWDSQGVNQLELSFILAASLAEDFFQASFNLSFYSNMKAINTTSRDYLSLEVKPNDNQREIIYTAMALLREKSIYELEDIIKKEYSVISPGATIFIIIVKLDQELIRTINYIKQKNVVVLITIGKDSERIAGIQQYYIDDKEDWHEIKKIELHR